MEFRKNLNLLAAAALLVAAAPVMAVKEKSAIDVKAEALMAGLVGTAPIANASADAKKAYDAHKKAAEAFAQRAARAAVQTEAGYALLALQHKEMPQLRETLKAAQEAEKKAPGDDLASARSEREAAQRDLDQALEQERQLKRDACAGSMLDKARMLGGDASKWAKKNPWKTGLGAGAVAAIAAFCGWKLWQLFNNPVHKAKNACDAIAKAAKNAKPGDKLADVWAKEADVLKAEGVIAPAALSALEAAVVAFDNAGPSANESVRLGQAMTVMLAAERAKLTIGAKAHNSVATPAVVAPVAAPAAQAPAAAKPVAKPAPKKATAPKRAPRKVAPQGNGGRVSGGCANGQCGLRR